MLIHKTPDINHEFTRSRYSRRVWKANHVAWGRYQTAGCWNTVHCGPHDERYGQNLQSAILKGSIITGVEIQYFRYFFECADAASVIVTMEGMRIEFSVDKKHYCFNQQNQVNFLKLLKAKGWYGTAGEAAAVARKAARTAAVAKTEALIGHKLPKPVEEQVEHSWIMAMIAAGVADNDIKRFYAWEKANAVILLGTNKNQRVEMFYERIPMLYWGAVNHGLSVRQVQEFTDWRNAQPLPIKGKLKTQVALFYRYLKTELGIPCPDEPAADAETDPLVKIAATLAKSSPNYLMPTEISAKAKPESWLHDGHVMAYRRQRANRLKALRRVAVREGQGLFRLQVLGNFGGLCCITGLMDDIEAAHIMPHADTANQHPANGLPLAKFLHSAFDTGMFTINPFSLVVVVAEHALAWLKNRRHQDC